MWVYGGGVEEWRAPRRGAPPSPALAALLCIARIAHGQQSRRGSTLVVGSAYGERRRGRGRGGRRQAARSRPRSGGRSRRGGAAPARVARLLARRTRATAAPSLVPSSSLQPPPPQRHALALRPPSVPLVRPAVRASALARGASTVGVWPRVAVVVVARGVAVRVLPVAPCCAHST